MVLPVAAAACAIMLRSRALARMEIRSSRVVLLTACRVTSETPLPVIFGLYTQCAYMSTGRTPLAVRTATLLFVVGAAPLFRRQGRALRRVPAPVRVYAVRIRSGSPKRATADAGHRSARLRTSRSITAGSISIAIGTPFYRNLRPRSRLLLRHVHHARLAELRDGGGVEAEVGGEDVRGAAAEQR